MKNLLKLVFITILLTLTSNAICQTFDIYVSDAGGFTNPPWYIYKFDENGENGEVFINEELSWPQDIVFLEDQGIVLISNLNTNKITKHDAALGNYLGDFATNISGPTRMKIGADSLLYVLQWGGNGLVKRYQLDGTYVDDYTDTGVSNSIGLDWDSGGNLYVSSYNASNVQRFNGDGDDQGHFINSNLQGPTNIWFDDNGDFFACNWNGTFVSKFDSDGNFIEPFITGLSNPEGVAIYPNGNILIGNGGTSSVKLFDADGNYIEDIIESGAAGLAFPNAVVLRENTTVSVSQVAKEANFIRPSIGTEFFLNTLTVQNFESIAIYNFSGMLIEQKKITSNQIWNAGKYPDGVYLILATAATGKTITF